MDSNGSYTDGIKGSLYDASKRLYVLNDKISFRKCTLFDKMNTSFGDCTNFDEKEVKWQRHFFCKQDGIHLHCTKHPGIELERQISPMGTIKYFCSRCGESIEIDDEELLRHKCLKMLNIPEFNNAKLIRLDDWYVHEITKREKLESGYWITTGVKKDKDGDTIIVVYVGHKDSKEKAQYFIKPEKRQLTYDHKDMDPAKILSKIEVQFKDRKITQEYE